jgi:hypothetical protein
MIRTCPRCRLVNPPEAQRCDCGYDFESQRVGTSPLTSAERAKAVGSTNTVLLGCVYGVLGGVCGSILVAGLQMWWYRYSGDSAADTHGYVALFLFARALAIGAVSGVLLGLLLAVGVSVRRNRRLR